MLYGQECSMPPGDQVKSHPISFEHASRHKEKTHTKMKKKISASNFKMRIPHTPASVARWSCSFCRREKRKRHAVALHVIVLYPSSLLKFCHLRLPRSARQHHIATTKEQRDRGVGYCRRRNYHREDCQP